MPKRKKGTLYQIENHKMPKPLDRFGLTLMPGDLIVYPVRKQADMRIVPGKIRDYKWEIELETEEKFCTLYIWMIASEKPDYLIPRKTVLLQPSRAIRYSNPDALNMSEELKMLSDLPIDV